MRITKLVFVLAMIGGCRTSTSSELREEPSFDASSIIRFQSGLTFKVPESEMLLLSAQESAGKEFVTFTSIFSNQVLGRNIKEFVVKTDCELMHETELKKPVTKSIKINQMDYCRHQLSANSFDHQYVNSSERNQVDFVSKNLFRKISIAVNPTNNRPSIVAQMCNPIDPKIGIKMEDFGKKDMADFSPASPFGESRSQTIFQSFEQAMNDLGKGALNVSACVRDLVFDMTRRRVLIGQYDFQTLQPMTSSVSVMFVTEFVPKSPLKEQFNRIHELVTSGLPSNIVD
jgi:hypothetical protein